MKHKLAHEYLQQVLLATGEALLVETAGERDAKHWKFGESRLNTIIRYRRRPGVDVWRDGGGAAAADREGLHDGGEDCRMDDEQGERAGGVG